MFLISYDYSVVNLIPGQSKTYTTYTNNLVGKDGKMPVGYGPVGPPALFFPEEIPTVVEVLTKQLGTVPTLHLHPQPY